MAPDSEGSQKGNHGYRWDPQHPAAGGDVLVPTRALAGNISAPTRPPGSQREQH